MYSNLPIRWKYFYFLAIPLVWLIIFTNTYSFTRYYYNDYMHNKNHYIFKFIISFLFYFCSLMTTICHTYSMLTNPGFITPEISNKLQSMNQNEKTFCKKCEKYRPNRAHHCSTCGRCVLKMDHHCPWIFNCVGFYNQKYFFLFLLYGTVGDFISGIILILRMFEPSFIRMILHPRRRINPYEKYLILEVFKSLCDPFLILTSACLSIGMAISIGMLFFRQYYQIMRNVTTLETIIADDELEQIPFYCKDKSKRWFMMKTVIGLGSKWKWFFPIMEMNKYNNEIKPDTPYKRVVPPRVEKPDNKRCNCLYQCCCC